MNSPDQLAPPQSASERMAYLSIGSNIDPLGNVRRSLALLRALPGVAMVAVSSLYRTSPWGGVTEAEFLNLAVALQTDLSARRLLTRTQRIELALGRKRSRRNAARTMDIDLLLIGAEQHRDADLCVPHPGLLERDFMLLPLVEIAPELRDPRTGERLADQCGRIRYQQIIERLPMAQVLDETGLP
ncbi:2-amino-4-hydroxy-6-hydroxymethyldihydropteridine diphosphokinase [Thiorhodovibrio frisius]|uniref:2-amino-4-hydroxy-6-hydroxymethyldihydropteridine pyrophosphokinase n=1 Tax=Thiorhodovibrio frisius TaxID=631362 RepID=H8YY31_9GAMM|nr:2-amino-4-hydroxy-6-hydroxymethyldihydropteridine diphosphokinase [Thiorhodovibrio frisius]EIC23357.1 2-amino-4-hydroxy-6-hydroxymethyldihydropteridine pyrophosphokinase [Thiorhodovibrio frisius]WPL23562.1 2-amino-4-hydroxy-6-hydroxymethyldihydropteridine pyrophosphokinase [Thiorhodovibrio frisius]